MEKQDLYVITLSVTIMSRIEKFIFKLSRTLITTMRSLYKQAYYRIQTAQYLELCGIYATGGGKAESAVFYISYLPLHSVLCRCPCGRNDKY